MGGGGARDIRQFDFPTPSEGALSNHQPNHFQTQNARRSPRVVSLRTTSQSRPSGTRCREREVASAIWSTEARPFARSTVGWVRGGRVAEGSRPAGCSDFQRSVSNKKGALRPCDAVSGAVSTNQRSLHLSQSLSSDFHHNRQVPVLYHSALFWV